MTGSPSERRPCPACACDEVVSGSLVASDADQRFDGSFHPAGLKFFALRRSVSVSEQRGFLACTRCGCLWSFVDAPALRRVLENRSTGESPFAPGLSHGARWLLLLLGIAGAAALLVLLVR